MTNLSGALSLASVQWTMGPHPGLLLLPLLQPVLAADNTRSAGYLRTTNISQTNFEQSTKETSTKATFLECAHACLFLDGESGTCNAFSYDSKPCPPHVPTRGKWLLPPGKPDLPGGS